MKERSEERTVLMSLPSKLSYHLAMTAFGVTAHMNMYRTFTNDRKARVSRFWRCDVVDLVKEVNNKVRTLAGRILAAF